MPDDLDEAFERVEKRMQTEPLSLRIILPESEDASVQCISALCQVMHAFQTHGLHPTGPLSANGKDIRAVYAWFTGRYNPDITMPARKP